MALDVGAKRIGVAIASSQARLARPMVTLENNQHTLEDIDKLIAAETVGEIVVGLPRNLDGEATGQTAETLEFSDQLRARFDIPVNFQDEALTSRKAEAELEQRGKPYNKEDIDALAATYILEDYLRSKE
jgi:putative holliday junction resolvase